MTSLTHDDILKPAEAKKIVEAGYDALSEQYTKVRRLSKRDRIYIDMLVEMLPPEARLLDLGCGGGGPITKELASAIIESAQFVCECIECGKVITSNKHCADLECSKCGGQMRRKNRPGPGR